MGMHSLEEVRKDVDYPRHSTLGYEKLHDWNIEVIYSQAKKLSHSV